MDFIVLKKRCQASSNSADMNDPALTQHTSASVEDYLKAIWEVAGSDPASTRDVARRLSVAAASVTNMFVRLREMRLVEYERYHGATLTETGRAEALRLVRRHRLIETFLLKHLAYSWEEVHEEAERLEHAVSDGYTERLAEFLGHPSRDPHGAPIPAADSIFEPDDSSPLNVAEAGEIVLISRVVHRNAEALAYLGENGLVPGRLLKVKEVRGLDGVVTVEDEDGSSHSLGSLLASTIFVHAPSVEGD